MSNRETEKQIRHGLNYSFGSQGLQNLAPSLRCCNGQTLYWSLERWLN